MRDTEYVEELKEELAEARARNTDMLLNLQRFVFEIERRGMCINMDAQDPLAIAYREACAAIAKAEGKEP